MLTKLVRRQDARSLQPLLTSSLVNLLFGQSTGSRSGELLLVRPGVDRALVSLLLVRPGVDRALVSCYLFGPEPIVLW